MTRKDWQFIVLCIKVVAWCPVLYSLGYIVAAAILKLDVTTVTLVP